MYEILTTTGRFVATVHTLGEAMFVVRHRAAQCGMRCVAVYGNQTVYWAY